MALSGLPPPLPPQMPQTCLTSSPALMPRLTASGPQTAWKVIFSPLTLARTATTEGSLSRRKSPIWRRAAASMPSLWAVRTLMPPTSLALMRKLRASPKEASAFICSRCWRRSFISVSCCSMRLSSSPGVVFRIWAARRSICWLALMVSRVRRPTVASMRRTPEATLPSLLMRKAPALAVLSRWVPPQNSIETSPISTTRTTSPYFSPKAATAPFFRASSMGRTSVMTG